MDAAGVSELAAHATVVQRVSVRAAAPFAVPPELLLGENDAEASTPLACVVSVLDFLVPLAISEPSFFSAWHRHPAGAAVERSPASSDHGT